ncbi:Ribosomal small subunit Rsm22 [Thermoanaerobacterium xylanolyticum LX-11]|uniref:Ribosomal small subunit Rsm22 n=1 Tax=Thermoanaerobacterium xylanolyticum (strain ATCC 49914 / DSM 7097 / LX-11) TaxID=858215 RepID=F6BJ56_THEXL|nr:small ribosomal subunit Rsm22 family protein [Thermoanaerobacterium xylanolyticum]AEF17873.1 Ribosomal small subunit Rsm22 [Thermoanaerobacterium xylanolyticum LX-11]
MEIPVDLLNGIEEESNKIPINKLISLVSDISNRYRNTDDKHISSYEEAIAYISYRMPATFAVIYAVLKDIKDICSNINPKSILDVGAGPGTAMWAATSIWNDIEQITLLEKNKNMIKIGKNLSANSNNSSIKNSIWLEADLENLSELPKHDIVIASYSIGELNEDVQSKIIKKLWESAANDILIIIEPGTKIGFSIIKRARETLISLGAHVIAPCPHANECPINDNDWCHFSSRVQRTSIHRKVKNGQLPYEDEKFSYICVSKKHCNMIKSRIIRHPQIRKGHIILDLCTKDGIKKVTVKKSDGDIYKKSRNSKWGSVFE